MYPMVLITIESPKVMEPPEVQCRSEALQPAELARCRTFPVALLCVLIAPPDCCLVLERDVSSVGSPDVAHGPPQCCRLAGRHYVAHEPPEVLVLQPDVSHGPPQCCRLVGQTDVAHEPPEVLVLQRDV